VYDPNGTLTVDIQSDATDINTLRRAYALQRFLERDNIAGTRYSEKIRAHFETFSSDARLQRSELIGTSRGIMNISEVLATAQNSDPDSLVAVGEMTGHGVSLSGGQRFSYSCEEHGFIIGVVTVEPTTAYQQGLPRMFKRPTFLDYPWPTFAKLGEQVVNDLEIYADPTAFDNWAANDPAGVFGYQSRYADYKFIPNTLHGTFRTTNEMCTMARKFSDTPDLNDDFIHVDETDDDLQRVFAVLNVEHVYMQVTHRISATRPLPFFNIPSLE